MKVVNLYQNKWEAELAAQFLRSHDIKSEVQGHKEYVSHITGSDIGRFELSVDQRYYEEAKELLAKAQSSPLAEKVEVSPQRYLKRSVVFALLACFLLPLVFNAVSISNLISYRRSENDPKRRWTFTFLVLLLQTPTLIPLSFYFTGVMKWLEHFRVP